MFPILDASSLSPEAGWGANEVIQIIPAELSTEDVMRIWDALDPPYRLSVSYIARLVRLDPDHAAAGAAGGGDALRLRRGGAGRDAARCANASSAACWARCAAWTRPRWLPIDEPLVVSAPGARLLRNRSGLYVIHSWTRLAAHEDAFDAPPAAPAVGSESLVLDVRDPSRQLSGAARRRSRCLAIPRRRTWSRPDSLFRAVDVPMYPAASAPLSANWVELRATVRETGERRRAWAARSCASSPPRACSRAG